MISVYIFGGGVGENYLQVQHPARDLSPFRVPLDRVIFVSRVSLPAMAEDIHRLSTFNGSQLRL
jgi:hypothetical protein